MVLFSFTENVEAARREHPQASAGPRRHLSGLPRRSLSSLGGASLPLLARSFCLGSHPLIYPRSVPLLIFGFCPLHLFSLVRGGCGIGAEWELVSTEGLLHRHTEAMGFDHGVEEGRAHTRERGTVKRG